MLKEITFFRALCRLCVAFFLFLVFFPLATLAFQRTGGQERASPAVEDSVQNNIAAKPVFLQLEPDPSPLEISGLPTYDPLTTEERQNGGLPTSLPSTTPYYGEKVVYLTFDDGPDPDNTPAILKILREHNVKATFFVIGTETEKHPEILKQTFNEGHAIGNHTYNHIYRDLYKSSSAYTGQLNRTDEIIKNLVGVRPRITRAPGGSAGSFTPEYWQALKDQGYAEIGWNISSGDASRSKASQIIGNITLQINKNKFLWSHAIVLMHDGRGHEETVKALPEIIKFFKSQDFEFRVVNLHTPPAW